MHRYQDGSPRDGEEDGYKVCGGHLVFDALRNIIIPLIIGHPPSFFVMDNIAATGKYLRCHLENNVFCSSSRAL